MGILLELIKPIISWITGKKYGIFILIALAALSGLGWFGYKAFNTYTEALKKTVTLTTERDNYKNQYNAAIEANKALSDDYRQLQIDHKISEERREKLSLEFLESTEKFKSDIEVLTKKNRDYNKLFAEKASLITKKANRATSVIAEQFHKETGGN